MLARPKIAVQSLMTTDAFARPAIQGPSTSEQHSPPTVMDSSSQNGVPRAGAVSGQRGRLTYTLPESYSIRRGAAIRSSCRLRRACFTVVPFFLLFLPH